MKPFLAAALILLTACGTSQSVVVGASATPVPADPPAVQPTADPTAEPSPAPTTAAGESALELQALTDARSRWQRAGLSDYDYTYSRLCFCPPEFVGPYRVSVRDGQVTAATFEGTDLLDLDLLQLDSYVGIVLTVDEVFDEIERALVEAHSFEATYHPELGYPTEVFIDWDELVADEEVGFAMSELGAVEADCSTHGSGLVMTVQPALPSPVALTRQAIFTAALECDIDALVALTSPQGFTASFGGDDPTTLWTLQEAEGSGPLLELVQHLNLAFTASGDDGPDGIYTWPSAVYELEASDGTGLSPDDYQELLTLYSHEELHEMFDGLGAYIGYRIGITAEGEWVYFVAGD